MEKKMFKKIAITTLLSTGLLLAESSAGININETDLEIEGTIDSRNLASMQTSSTIFQVDFNLINIEEDDFDAKLVGIGFGATNQLEGVEGVELTFGTKFIWSNVDTNEDDDGFKALPLMAKLRYSFPPLMFNIPPVALEAKVLYAPGALSFGDAESYREFRASADMEMIENVRIYGGYRNINTGFALDDSFTFNNGFFGGIKFIY